MMSDNFESAFDCFLERQEYDEAESALFTIVRAAFLAGWKSAGGEPPQPQKVIEICSTAPNELDTSKSDNH